MGFLTGQVQRRSWIGEPPIPPFPGASLDGSPRISSMESALVVPTVWKCTNLIANAVSLMPLETFRRTDGVPLRITDPQLVTSPAAGMTQSEWIHQLMVSALLRGNGIGLIASMDSQGRPTQIELQNPDRVGMTQNPDGQIDWRINGTSVPRERIWHMPGMTLPGSKIGLSPISYAAALLGMDLNARKFGSDFLAGGGVPKAVVETTTPLTREQGRTIKDTLLAATRNREPAIMGAGATYKQISVSPEESQFLATLQADKADIADFFSIPGALVGGNDGNSMTYSNRVDLLLDFLTYCVGFWLKRIEDAFFPLLPQPQFVKFDEQALLRVDPETQARVDVILIAGKIEAPSEVRNRRQMPPLTDDQKAEMNMVPLTITPTGGAKALPNLKLPPGPAADVPADDQQGDPNAA